MDRDISNNMMGRLLPAAPRPSEKSLELRVIRRLYEVRKKSERLEKNLIDKYSLAEAFDSWKSKKQSQQFTGETMKGV